MKNFTKDLLLEGQRKSLEEKTHQKLELATFREIGSFLSNGSRNSSTSKASKRRIELNIGVSKKVDTSNHEI